MRLLLMAVLASLFPILIGLFPTSKLLAASVVPFSADAFVDSVGIVSHIGFSDTPYAQNWGKQDRTQSTGDLLADLGVRHVREGIPNPTYQPYSLYVRPRLAQLYRDYGIRTLSIVDRRVNGILAPDQIDAYLDDYATSAVNLDGQRVPIREFLEAIEGPNEYDMHNQQSARDPDWAKNLKNYQSALYQKVKQRSQLAQMPVIMPSLIYTQYCNSDLGSMANSLDYGNLHPYPNYPYFSVPTSSLGWHLSAGRSCFSNKSIYVTETGYLSGTNGISDRTIAKYMSVLLPEYFLRPQVKRTYLYSLIDTLPERDRWGLISARRSGQVINGRDQFTLTPKPSYYAIQSLLGLLKEGEWDKDQKKWIVPTVNLKPVDIVVDQKQDSTHYLLLQKSTGDYFLLLWQQIESFNPTAGNFEPSRDEVRVSLPEGYQFQSLYQYDDSFKLQGTPLTKPTNRMAVQVPDSITVLQFRAIAPK